MKKRSLTLLELLISLSLFALILSFIFSTFHLQTKKRKCIQCKKEASLEKHYLHQRLEKIFSSAGDCPSSIQDHWAFYTENQQLFFTFDNGVFTQPKLSSYVHAVLWLDEKEQMMNCALFPLKDKETSYTFPLLDRVENLRFSFYSSEKKIWQTHWERGEEIPAFLKISYNRDQKLEQHYFNLKKILQIKR